ncbi:MAG TPA: uracil-DNA glycosylase [Candidatus Acidoferrales bacterium]|nr:uracil-DNA glycosylase [Candidatus Acidoferrales bacterium]
MDEINSQVYACHKCRLWQGAKHGVPGEGSVNAKIMIVGQNPGAEEDETGKPFVGRAGQFLTKSLREFGINRADFFITNIVKHTSPKNRKPLPDEIQACVPYLITQIEIIKPKIIVLLGESAKKTPRMDGIEYFEIIHPSAAMRFPKTGERFRLQIAELAQKIKALNAQK